MTHEQIANAIRKRFKDEVATPQSLPTFYDNEGTEAKPADGPWCRFSVRPGEDFQVSTGGDSRRFRTPGVAVAQLFAPAGSGDKVLKELVDVVRVKFRALTADGVTYRTPHEEVMGRDSKWWQINVVCVWYADDIG